MKPSLGKRGLKLLKCSQIEGCIVEFGVYRGEGLCTIARLARKNFIKTPQIFGFDSFEGMPLTNVPLAGKHVKGWAEGSFGNTSLQLVQRKLQSENVPAKLFKGVFSELSDLSNYGIQKIAFAHLDADIYEGYKDALALMTPYFQVGSILLFDENKCPSDHLQQDIRDHGKKAVEEWERLSGFNLHLIRFEGTVTLNVIVDEDYLKQYAKIIETLRRDTVFESMKNVAKIVLRK